MIVAPSADFVSIAAFALVALIFAAAARLRPALALAMFIASEPFDCSRSLGFTTITLPKTALLAIIVGLVLRRASVLPLLERPLRPLLGGLAATVAVTALTIVPATFYDPVLRETFKALEYALIACTAVVAYAADPDEEMIWRGLGASAGLVCILAIAQEFTTAPSGFFVGPVLGKEYIPRIAGPLEGPNQLAGWLGIAVTMLATKTLAERRSAVFASLTCLGLVADALSFSRAGILSLALGIGLAARGSWRRDSSPLRHATAIVIALAVVLGASIVPFLLSKNIDGIETSRTTNLMLRITGNDEQSNENGLAPRSALWHAAYELFERDPGLGIGAGNFEFLTPTVGLSGVRTHANSAYLQALSEGGLALLGATLWTIGAALVVLCRKPRSILAIAIAAATCVYASHQAFDTLDFFPKIADLWYVLIGIGAGRANLAAR